LNTFEITLKKLKEFEKVEATLKDSETTLHNFDKFEQFETTQRNFKSLSKNLKQL